LREGRSDQERELRGDWMSCESGGEWADEEGITGEDTGMKGSGMKDIERAVGEGVRRERAQR